MRLRRLLFLSLASATVVALLPANVFASDFRLRVEDISNPLSNGYGVVLTDGNTYAAPGGQTVGDENETEGLLQVGLQPLSGAVSWNLTLGISKPQPMFDPSGTDPLGGMRLTSFNVTSSGAATIRITLEDTGFLNLGSGSVGLKSILGGAFDTSNVVNVSATSWANTLGVAGAPVLGADTTGYLARNDGTGTYQLQPGELSAIGANVGEHADTLSATSAGVGYEEFSGETFKALADSGPSYTLFTQLIITFSGAGSVDFYHDTLLEANEQLTPEPGSLMLIGTALVGLAMRRRALMN
jgi:hypothetical protein